MSPRDLYGLTLSTTPEAAAHYNEALGLVLRVRPGADLALRRAVEADPGFALGHSALALLGHEQSLPVDVDAALAAAARGRGTDRERSHVAATTGRVRGSAAALRSHLRHYPRDAMLVSAALPTIAFSGVTGAPRRVWELIESLAPAYGDDWWYAGLLAFVRQEQERFTEAARLSERALAVEPRSGHAAHALAHVYYETGAHADGLAWLDGWIRTSGLDAGHGVHYAWHAALHELAEGDVDAVRRRYARQLAPPAVTGVRLLVDSASLLWRGELGGVWCPGTAPVSAVLAHVDGEMLRRPRSGFVAVHAALALATAGDARGLAELHRYACSVGGPVFGDVVAPAVAGLLAYVEGSYASAATLLTRVRPVLPRIGGSKAQREVFDDTLLHALLAAGHLRAAHSVAERRAA
jgi:hypothetical protein